MSNPLHLLICGEIGVGKSTLIRRLLAESGRPLCGFCTKRIPQENGSGSVYLHPAIQPESSRRYGPENLVGQGDTNGFQAFPQVFDTYGISLLDAPENGLLLMDELGFLESGAPLFRAGVLSALDGDVPVLAAVKTRDTPFLRAVREHPRAAVYFITPENREALYQELAPIIRRWNGCTS